jgi:hypothetical protein
LGVLARFCKSKFWEISIDRLRTKLDRSNLSSIDRVLQNFRIFQAISHEFCHSSLVDLQNIKTQKLTKASENNKAKCLTNVNQGVQIHNIWHSSISPHLLLFLSASRAGCQLFSDYGGSDSYPGGHEFHAAVYVIHGAGGSLHQPSGRAKSAGPPGLSQVPPPIQQ